jgi:3-oxoacyl-[acyl-carrier-protein] synthase II
MERIDRSAQMCVVATHKALTDASLFHRTGKEPTGLDIGIAVGTGVGTPHAIQKTYFGYCQSRSTSVHSVAACMPHSAAAVTGIRFGLTGPGLTLSTACSSGAVAIGLAFELIRSGVARAMVAGGCEASVMPLHLDNWSCLGVLSKSKENPARAVRPFSRDRKGFVLGEGAAMVVLEEKEAALKRGAEIYAEIVGYGASSDAVHITAPSADGQAKAMQAALDSAGVTAQDVDYINAHGTATQLNDKTETAAIRKVFGDGTPPVSGIKPITGHMLGASSAAECIASILALKEGMIPPTINLIEKDPECDLDFVSEGKRRADVRIAMSNSFAFGGNNAVLVMRRHEHA